MKDFNEMGKVELRAACKEAGIKNYGKMNNGLMREALEAHYAAQEEVRAEVEAEVEQVAPATEERTSGNEDPRNLDVCPVCGSDELYAGRNDSIGGGMGVVVDEDTVGGCHQCDWKYDLRGSNKPTGKGIKIEKDREERNGVKRPSVGGACRAVWDALDEMVAAGEQPTSKDVKALAEQNEWNANNASIEFYQWRKFHGIRGRQPKKV